MTVFLWIGVDRIKGNCWALAEVCAVLIAFEFFYLICRATNSPNDMYRKWTKEERRNANWLPTNAASRT